MLFETQNFLIKDVDTNSTLTYKEPESIYDMCWYPFMNSNDPSSCCFAVSSKDQPIHLWDAYNGSLRASYALIDHRERFVAPNSLCFTPDGTKILCGYFNSLAYFDVLTPGSDYTHIPLIASRKSIDGQKGIVSALSVCQTRGLIAVGTYSKTIFLYDMETFEPVLMLPEFQSGLTQIEFSHDGNFLFTASRCDDSIKVWDLRNCDEPLLEFPRKGMINQRLYFQLTSDYLITGDTDGTVSFYDINCLETGRMVNKKIGRDSIPAAKLFGDLLVTCQGSRCFEDEEVEKNISMWTIKNINFE
ncbi:hypothetical protein O9G_002468 [Rozella allomycis CSF55]|uniref:Uncharacterized protein n=1 Tax=Rozella allomycis (strain CSF55) TaxID=988480 RepID=A0A075AUR6_ROZAC|nr:hypothetical protein O9G_002468 [Rozella allomycis CSF55]|eukprot:EPZ33905.1 hypothetical protein O9G_002468 [Rozella allomycis CSF55]